MNLSLIGDNVTLSNPNLVNGVRATQVATFTNGGNAGLEMTKGVFFGTGLINQLLIDNNSLHRDDSPGGITTTFTDPDLNGISTQSKYDMVTYTFSVTTGPKATTLNIKYQFGSEEYPDYVGTRFNDAFGFFVSGGGLTATQNIGRLPNGQPTSINKVNFGFPGALQTTANADSSFDGTQSALYTNNGHPTTVTNGKLVTNDNSGPKPIIVQFNGITKLVTYTLSGLSPNTTYNFKIVIADLGDYRYDSGVFVNTIYGTATLVANNDTYSIISGNDSATSVLLNDSVNGTSNASLSDVTLSQVSTSNSGVNLNTATGLINVAPGTPAGVYTVNYRICDLTYLENCKTAVATVTVLANDPDGDGIDSFTDLDDDNDGILDTAEGFCATTGFEGFETNPLQPTVNGNNFQTGLSYNGWSIDGMTPTVQANPFNIIRVNNTTYSSGPASAQEGSQYLDINATGGNLYREFTLTTPTVLNASVFFSPRETSGTAIAFQSKIELIKLSGTSQTWSGNVINYNSLSPYVWTQSSLNNIALPAGTYRLQMFIHNNAHVDSISYCFSTDTDGDTIPDYLDVDSDNDGCPDAIEGSENVTYSMVNPLTATTNPGQISVRYDGFTTGTPSQIVSTATAANGVPQLVNNAINNTNSSIGLSNNTHAGLVDNTDGTADVGQGKGNSQDNSLNDCKCYRNPSSSGMDLPTLHGITSFNRAGSGNSNWPMVRNNGWTALESNTKPFVMNRMPSATANGTNIFSGEPLSNGSAAITAPVVGMTYYDTTNDCMKINIDGTRTGWKCFKTQSCPEEN
ncbi:choice-of-anchor L domain-containing protein [Chryseobacterium sp. RR2-3-20]|uniref:choice-of-anchor L domain-containing protein n=1 Tax=Chryseobacterium sp. RR2-3-20 TaxID=2787626 RepID=UPI0021D4839D|nr:choice-of-anchor L domain-containing protein [Chryseobacterium sp. RR2-3-20]